MLPPITEGRKMNRRRLSLLFLSTALLALAFLPTAASANSYGSQVTIDQGGPKGASGHVSSKQKRCRRGRRVSLFVEDPATGELVKVGTATTDGAGEWEVEVDLFAGDYVAKVALKIVYIHGMSHTCRGDRSLTQRL
jgi:hypothetical protein